MRASERAESTITQIDDTHLKTLGTILWLVGFTGAHRFYYGKPVTGTIRFFTLGLLGFGRLYDLWTLNDQVTMINRAG